MDDPDLMLKALLIRAPNDIGNAINENNCPHFTVPATSVAGNVLPASFRLKRYVIIHSTTGGDFMFAFSKDPLAVVDAAVVGTAGGVTAKIGGICRALGDRHVMLPEWGVGEAMYFCRMVMGGAAAGSCVVALGDFDPRNTEKPMQ